MVSISNFTYNTWKKTIFLNKTNKQNSQNCFFCLTAPETTIHLMKKTKIQFKITDYNIIFGMVDKIRYLINHEMRGSLTYYNTSLFTLLYYAIILQ